VVCPKCQNAIAKAEIENELTMRKSWVDRMRKLDEECGTKFSHVETDQWILHYSIPQWKIGDATLNRVKASLQWAIRLDAVSSLMRVRRCKRLPAASAKPSSRPKPSRSAPR
jgi:hypothetical protein